MSSPPATPHPINPARIDFVTLHLFRAVAQTGSITRGAQACHLALSAASRRLADFEAAAGSRLLERSAQGVRLTAAGHTALQHAIRLAQGFEHFGQEMHGFSRGVRGHVRLWANMSALTEFLPDALARFMLDHPRIQVEIEEQLSGDTVRALVDGLADIGIFADNIPAHGLEVARFRDDRLVLVCARRHPLARFRTLRFEDCLSHDFVGLNRGSSLLELTSQAAQACGKAMQLRVQVRSFDAMSQMIAANLGIGVMPLGACQGLNPAMGLRLIRLQDAWANRQLLLGTGSAPLSPAAALLRSHLLESPAGATGGRRRPTSGIR